MLRQTLTHRCVLVAMRTLFVLCASSAACMDSSSNASKTPKPAEIPLARNAAGGQADNEADPHDASADTASPSLEATEADASWQPLATDAIYAGRNLQEWAAAWVRWFFSQTSCDDPTFDKDGSECALYQDPDSPAFFLATGDPETIRTRCVVPEGKAIVAPLAVISWDNGGVPPDALLTDAQLREQVAEGVDTISALHLRVDGRDIAIGPGDYIVQPYGLSYVLPPKPNWYTCNGLSEDPGQIAPVYVGGAFVVLPPPTAGPHDLGYGGAISPGGLKSVNDVTTTLTIQ